MSELKPCPFCGGEARTTMNYCTIDGQLEWESFAIIHECQIVGRLCTHYFDTEAEAVEAWNTRREVLYTKPIEDGNGYFTSNRCGRCLEWLDYGWNYCPNCGARVIE